METKYFRLGTSCVVTWMLVTFLWQANAFSQEGRLVKETIHSPALEGNLLGNSAKRDVAVYLPPSYQVEKPRRFPVVYVLHGNRPSGFTLDLTQLHGSPITELMDSLIRNGTIREMILVYPNALGLHGGSQYANSTVSGN